MEGEGSSEHDEGEVDAAAAGPEEVQAAVEVGNEVEDSNKEASTTSDDVEQVNVEANSKRPLSDIFDESQTDAVPAGEEMQNDIEGGDIIKANSEDDPKTDESTTLECSGTADDVSSTCVDDQCTISCSDGKSVQLQCGEGESTSVNTEEVSDKLIVTASCGPELKFPPCFPFC